MENGQDPLNKSGKNVWWMSELECKKMPFKSKQHVYGCKPLNGQTGLKSTITLLLKHEFDVNSNYVINICSS